MRMGTGQARRRVLAGVALAAVTLGLPGGLASADDHDPNNDKTEAYPPQSTKPPVVPTTRPLPATGNDASDTWVKLGAGAVLVGGVLVAGASRRRREVEAS